MIAADQPRIFGNRLVVGLSSVEDGNMRDVGTLDARTIANFEKFVTTVGHTPSTTTYQLIRFEGDNYCRYTDVDHSNAPQGISTPCFADGTSVTVPGHALFLPVADCTPAIIFDPVHGALMLSHLGRHSTEQFGARRSVEYMTSTYGSRPEDLLVWLGPSPNGDEYPLWGRGNHSFKEVNEEDVRAAGVTADHLEISPVDTVHDANYFSHSEFLKGHRAQDGRFGVFAMLPL